MIRTIFVLVCSISLSTCLPTNITTAITEEVLLPCKIDVEPNQHTMVIWMGPNDEMISADHSLKISDERFELDIPNNKEYTIKIEGIKKKDEGGYECRVMQGEKMLSFQNFRVIVQTPPTMTTPLHNHIILNEDDSTELECGATGDPEPSLKWHFINPDKPHSNIDLETETPENLVLTKVKLNSNGRYECIADNGVVPTHKSVYNVAVKVSPKIQIPYMKVSQEMGKELMIECLVYWVPVGHVTWLFKKKKIISTLDRHRESSEMERYHSIEEVNKMKDMNDLKYRSIHHNITSKSSLVGLVVRSFSKKDIGRYKCVAENEMGQHEASIIALGDESSESRDINVIVGDDVVIPCKHNNNNNNNNIKDEYTDEDKNNNNNNNNNLPTWSRQTSKMEDFGMIVISQIKPLKSEKFQILENNDLKIHSVSKTDSGFYRCSMNVDDADDDDGEEDDEDEVGYLSVTATSASSMEDDNAGMISIQTFCIVIVAIIIIITTICLTIIFVIIRRKENCSFNLDDNSRFKG